MKLKRVCQEIKPLCVKHDIPFIFFVPDNVRCGYIPIVENTFNNVVLRLSASVIKRGPESINEANSVPIPELEEPKPYDEQYMDIVDNGETILLTHHCENNKCYNGWKKVTEGKYDLIEDRQSFVKEVRDLQRFADKQICPGVAIMNAFPEEKDLRLYGEEYTNDLQKIIDLLDKHKDCVYLFAMEYFDVDEDLLVIKFIYRASLSILIFSASNFTASI